MIDKRRAVRPAIIMAGLDLAKKVCQVMELTAQVERPCAKNSD